MSKPKELTTEETTNNKTSDSRRNNNKSRSNRSRGRKPNKSEKDFKGGLSKQGRDNDPNWYFTSPELANQAAELSFQSILGTGKYWGNYEVPTIMTIQMNPSPGISYSVLEQPVNPGNNANLPDGNYLDRRDGINLMASKIYTLLATYSGRVSNYAPQDVATMILAIGEVNSVIEDLRRAFGLAMTYNPRNRTMPIQLLNAIGYDADDMFANLANYRMKFNTAISRINQIPILDNIGYIRKCRDLYQRVYVDAPSSMAQMYVYVPNSTWIIDEDELETGTVLRTLPWFAETNTDVKLHRLDDMITALLESTTLNVIYADLINLSNKIGLNFQKFDYLMENYVVAPEYNRNALLQIHNLDIIGAPIEFATRHRTYTHADKHITFTDSNDVFHDPDNNSIMYCPAFMPVVDASEATNINNISYSGTFIDMDTDQPTLEDRIESMRFSILRSGYILKTSSAVVGLNKDLDVFPTLPDHYCTGISISRNSAETTPLFTKNVINSSSMHVAEVADLDKFNMAPMFYMGPLANTVSLESISGQLDFFTIIDFEYLSRLNRLIYTGLFDFRL